MWDRNPQHDLFQGNYSTCCIGMGEMNAEDMPTYLMNTAFNMIEIVDNNTGSTIGNALCYIAKDKYNYPELIIDNIEIKNSEIPSKQTGLELRNAIIQYAKNLCKSINGKGLPIWIGKLFNDIPCNDLPSYKHTCELLGNLANAYNVYVDAFDGWTDVNDLSDCISLYRVN